MLLQLRENLGLSRLRVLIQRAYDAQNHARRAIAALKGVLRQKGLLHGVKLAVPGEPFDCYHGLIVGVGNRRKTGGHAFAVEQHRASPALALTAAVFCAGQLQLLAQYIEQRSLWVRGDTSGLSVDGEFEGRIHLSFAIHFAPQALHTEEALRTGFRFKATTGGRNAKAFRTRWIGARALWRGRDPTKKSWFS